MASHAAATSTSSMLPHHEDGVVVAAPFDNTAALAVPMDYPDPAPIEQQLQAIGSSSQMSSTTARRPWYKRPSVWWALPLFALRMSTMSMQVPAQIELLTQMACRVHRPDLVIEVGRALPGDVLGAARGFLTRAAAAEDSHQLLSFPQLSSDEHHAGALNGSQPQDPPAAQICARDPTVERAVASILTVLTSTGGILTMITTGWWGQRSDMWGRTRILAVAVVAMASGELNLILVSHFGHLLPGTSYWWLIPGSIILGILGGGSGTPSIQAYMGDSVPPSARMSVFSIWGGVSFAAAAVGPVIGGELIRVTGNVLSVYYFSFAVNIFLFTLWAFIVPESLDESIRQANTEKHVEMLREREQQHPKPSSCLGRLFWFLNMAPMLELLRPLSIFLPRLKDPEDPRQGYDWNLTYTAMSYLTLVMVQGGSIFIMQLLKYEFGWDAVQLGYYFGTLGFVRAVYLLVILPGIFTLARPKLQAIALPGPEDQLNEAHESESPEPVARSEAAPSLDLTVVRLSLIADTITYTALVLAANSFQFVVFSMGLAFGAGLLPAFMSLGLALSPSGAAEGGKLFGAFGIMTSFGSEVLGQWTIGAIFISTVEVYPRAFIVSCAILLFVSFLATTFIRLPRHGTTPLRFPRPDPSVVVLRTHSRLSSNI